MFVHYKEANFGEIIEYKIEANFMILVCLFVWLFDWLVGCLVVWFYVELTTCKGQMSIFQDSGIRLQMSLCAFPKD